MKGPRPSNDPHNWRRSDDSDDHSHKYWRKTIQGGIIESFAKGTVSIGEAHAAIRTTESSIDPKSDRKLTFSGTQNVDLRPGVVIVSDPVELDVKSMAAISLFVAKSDGVPSSHTIGLHTSYITKGITAASQ